MTRRPLISLLAAETVSMTGSRTSVVAVPWLVLTMTGSPTRVGVVALAQTLPFVLAGLLGGPLVDRAGPRRAALTADVAGAVVVGLIPLLHVLGALSLGPLVVVAAVAGAVGGCGDTAKRALLPRVITASGTPMTRGTALYDGISRAAILLGLPLGGILVAAFGAPAVLAIDAVSFALGAAVLAAGVRAADAQATDARATTGDLPGNGAEPAHERYGAALRTGLAYLRRDRLAAAMVGLLFVTNLVDQAYTAVLVPVWVRDLGATPATLGILGGAFGLGAVAGNVAYTALATRLPRHTTFALCFLLGGSPRLFALAVTDAVWVVLAVSFAAGVAVAAVNPILFAVGYERIPAHLQGRVLGAVGALSFAGIPLGGLLAGVAVERFGLHAALLVGGAAYLAVTLTPFVVPHWRELDHGPPQVRATTRAGTTRTNRESPVRETTH